MKHLILFVNWHIFPFFITDHCSRRKCLIVYPFCDQVSFTFVQTIKHQSCLRIFFCNDQFSVFLLTAFPGSNFKRDFTVIKGQIRLRKWTFIQHNSLQQCLLFLNHRHFFIFFSRNIRIIRIAKWKCIVTFVCSICFPFFLCFARHFIVSIRQIFLFSRTDNKIFYSSQTIQDRSTVQIIVLIFSRRIQIHFIKKITDISDCDAEIIWCTVGSHLHGRVFISMRPHLIITIQRRIFCI